ncbi:hypothetical protein BST36_30850, partial [Mycolicibacterium moriokaense]
VSEVLVMDDVLGYEGKSVVVTGAASGMGQAAAQILVDLGATVTASRPFRVIQWATGAVGTEMVRTIIDHRPDIELVGARV